MISGILTLKVFFVPNVINDKCIGGFGELMSLNQSGELKEILSSEN